MEDGHRASADNGRRDQITRFAADLRDLRARAGDPSFRKMAGRSGHISHTTLHEAASGSRFPSWETTREFVKTCGQDPAEWRARWDAVKDALSELPAAEVPAAETPPSDVVASTPPEAVASVPAEESRPGRFQWLWIAASVVLLLVITGTVFSVKRNGAPDWAANIVDDGTKPVHLGDRSIFVDDVTIPDKSPIKAGERFLKVWEIQNTGSVLWHNRFLERMDPPVGEQDCQTPRRIKIGDTLPDERVKVGVPVTAPTRPGTICFARWKMVDEQGRELLPSSRPVYFEVRIVP